ncbi:MAG: helix-turn-helix transcriptional regulator [Rhodospirillales bacterium]|nr:helix-turn-helix transcriptional regulator [Rhodospirillales bacterium]
MRTSAGISQEELADRAGLHRTYISSIERAQRNVSLENIFLIAEALGATPAELLKPIPNGRHWWASRPTPASCGF